AQLPPSTARAGRDFRPISDEVRELEHRRMLEALESTDWNRTRAAAAIQMPLRTFVTRYKQLHLGKHGR
ncbi:MAG: helix-turn-helix domain-containing protein, partial [Myxococcaceae bacterium]